MPHETDDRDDATSSTYSPSITDRARYLRYTLMPTLYVDESSDTSDLLWQQVLEQRGTRYWLAVLTTVLLTALIVAVVALVTP